jgi:hypothetical protein
MSFDDMNFFITPGEEFTLIQFSLVIDA